MKGAAVEVLAWRRAQRAAPDFAVEMVKLGQGDYAVIDAKGRYWLCRIKERADTASSGRGSAVAFWTLIPIFGPVEPEGTFQFTDEQDLIARVETARRPKEAV